MPSQVFVENDVARRLGLLLLVLVGPFEPMAFGEPHLYGRAIALHDAMLVVGITSAKSVVPACPVHDLPAEVERLAHGLPG